jgi:hypothetical protein
MPPHNRKNIKLGRTYMLSLELKKKFLLTSAFDSSSRRQLSRWPKAAKQCNALACLIKPSQLRSANGMPLHNNKNNKRVAYSAFLALTSAFELSSRRQVSRRFRSSAFVITALEGLERAIPYSGVSCLIKPKRFRFTTRLDNE